MRNEPAPLKGWNRKKTTTQQQQQQLVCEKAIIAPKTFLRGELIASI